MESKFYQCAHCGNIVVYAENKGVPVVCCGEKMKELIPNTTDAAQEKHIPVVTVSGSSVRVQVGSVNHPMTAEHSIRWVWLETKQGIQKKSLAAGDAPVVTFALAEGDEAVAVWAYCNLHGLWLTTL
jgi:superoxide reductase